jgi:hypothetical protein
MSNLDHQDPVLAPDAELTLVDDSSELMPPLDATTNDDTKSSLESLDDPQDIPPKFLEVKHQTVKDALGNIGDFTGSIDVATNLPHGHGEMKYSLSEGNHDSGNNNSVAPTLVATHKGFWDNGYWHGHGIQTLNNGDTFSGEF